MSDETRKRMLDEFRRSLPAILEGRDPHRVNDYRHALGLPPMETEPT